VSCILVARRGNETPRTALYETRLQVQGNLGVVAIESHETAPAWDVVPARLQ
jgi:hypothetical protein